MGLVNRNLRLIWIITLIFSGWLMTLTMFALTIGIRVGQSMTRIQNVESHAGAQDAAIFAIARAIKFNLGPQLQTAPAPRKEVKPMTQISITPQPLTETVRALLVTGTDDQLHEFNLIVSGFLNAIDRRGQTIRYACMIEDRDAAIAAAQYAGTTLEEILFTHHGNETTEVYEVISQGDNDGWRSGTSVEGAKSK